MSFWQRLSNTAAKWKAFFFPVKGWKERFKLYQRGTKTWSVPYDANAPKVLPWPVEWFPHRRVIETDAPEDKERGFVFLDTTCVDSGMSAPLGVAACCVRCGVHLHPEAAHMLGGFDPPICSRCYWVIKLKRI